MTPNTKCFSSGSSIVKAAGTARCDSCSANYLQVVGDSNRFRDGVASEISQLNLGAVRNRVD